MLRAYEEFLTKKGTVKTQYVPYYLKWVSDCYGFLDKPLPDRLGGERSMVSGNRNKVFLLPSTSSTRSLKSLSLRSPSSNLINESGCVIPFRFTSQNLSFLWIKFQLVNDFILINKPMLDCISNITDHFNVPFYLSC
jgi:hypothetical protein